MVPALVAPQRLHDVVGRVGVHRAVAADVGDRRGRELEVTEAPGEVVLLVPGQELARGRSAARAPATRRAARRQVSSSSAANRTPVTVAPNVASSGSTSIVVVVPMAEPRSARHHPRAGRSGAEATGGDDDRQLRAQRDLGAVGVRLRGVVRSRPRR